MTEPQSTEPSDEELLSAELEKRYYSAGLPECGLTEFAYDAGRASLESVMAKAVGDCGIEIARLKAEVEALKAELIREKARGDFHRDIASRASDKGEQLDGALTALEFAAQRDLAQHQELEALRGERQALVNRVNVLEGCAAIAERERDELHAALAWMASVSTSIEWFSGNGAPCVAFFGTDGERHENHDNTDAGRAAALVRLWERVTGGDHG